MVLDFNENNLTNSKTANLPDNRNRKSASLPDLLKTIKKPRPAWQILIQLMTLSIKKKRHV